MPVQTLASLEKRDGPVVDGLAGTVSQLLLELNGTLKQLTGLKVQPLLLGSLNPLGMALQAVSSLTGQN